MVLLRDATYLGQHLVHQVGVPQRGDGTILVLDTTRIRGAGAAGGWAPTAHSSGADGAATPAVAAQPQAVRGREGGTGAGTAAHRRRRVPRAD